MFAFLGEGHQFLVVGDQGCETPRALNANMLAPPPGFLFSWSAIRVGLVWLVGVSVSELTEFRFEIDGLVWPGWLGSPFRSLMNLKSMDRFGLVGWNSRSEVDGAPC